MVDTTWCRAALSSANVCANVCATLGERYPAVLVHATTDVGSPGTPLATTVYFATPGRVSLLEPPTPCPGYPPLHLAGIAVDDYDGLYLVVEVHGITAWLGPTLREVRRRTDLLAGAVSGQVNPPLADWRGVLEWLTDAWGVAASPGHPDLPVRQDEETLWLADVMSHQDEPAVADASPLPHLTKVGE